MIGGVDLNTIGSEVGRLLYTWIIQRRSSSPEPEVIDRWLSVWNT